MQKRTAKWLFLALALVLVPVLAWAQDKPNLTLSIAAQKEAVVKDKDGKPKSEWRDVNDINPGDIVRYVIRYANSGKAEVRNAVITDPVPSTTTYIPDTAKGKGAEITYSLDGKSFQSAPMLSYKVKQPDGTEVEYKATPDMYTHIRWRLIKPVPAGGSGTVSFKVKVK